MQHNMSMYNIYTHIIYLATYYLHNIHVTLWCQMVVLQANKQQLESMQHMSMYNIYTHIIYLATYYLHNIHVLYVTLWCQMVVLQTNKQILYN